MKPNRPLETEIQRDIVKWLDLVLDPAYRVFAIPNAARRTRTGRAANAVPGIKPGVPDLIIVGQGHAYFLEVKRDKNGALSGAQVDWYLWCHAAGSMPWARVWSVDQVRDLLKEWNIPTREAR